MLCILWHTPEVIFGSLHCLVAWSPLAGAFLAWLLSVLFLKMADGDDDGENEVFSDETDSEEEQSPILIAKNAGANLRSPASAAINRKRKLYVNEGKYKLRGSQKSVKMSVWDRIKEYPNQHFCNKNGKLRCNACSEMISSKKSSIEKHIKFKKHEKGIADIVKSKAESQTIMECLKRRDQRDRASSSTLPEETRLFRFEIVESALCGGIAVAKLDKLRPVLQRYGHRLTSCPPMHQIIPAVLEKVPWVPEATRLLNPAGQRPAKRV